MSLRKLRILYSIHLFFHFLPVGLFFPISTLFLIDKGFSLGWIGTALSVYSITILVLELPTGGLADKLGRIKLYRISRIFSLISLILLLLCNTLVLLFLAMVVNGIARALSSGSMDAWFVDMHKDKKDLQKSMALSEGISPAALGFCTLLGGWIPDFIQTFNFSYSFGKYDYNLLLGIIGIFIHLIFHFISFKKDITENKNENIKDFSNGLLRILKESKTLKYLLAISFILGIGLNAVEIFWQPWVNIVSPQSPSFILGILASIYFFAASVGTVFSINITKVLGEKVTLIIMKIFHGIALIVLGFWSNIYSFSFGFALVFIFHGVLSVPHMTLLHKTIPSSYRASLLSIDSLAMMAGVSISSALIGWLAQSYSIPLVWGIAGFCVIISSLLYLPIKMKRMDFHESTVQ